MVYLRKMVIFYSYVTNYQRVSFLILEGILPLLNSRFVFSEPDCLSILKSVGSFPMSEGAWEPVAGPSTAPTASVPLQCPSPCLFLKQYISTHFLSQFWHEHVHFTAIQTHDVRMLNSFPQFDSTNLFLFCFFCWSNFQHRQCLRRFLLHIEPTHPNL